MSILASNHPDIIGVQVTPTDVFLRFTNDRVAKIPLPSFPRLLHATFEQRSDWRLIGGGEGVHWEQLDEDISAKRIYSDSSLWCLTANDLRAYDWQSIID